MENITFRVEGYFSLALKETPGPIVVDCEIATGGPEMFSNETGGDSSPQNRQR